MKGTKELVRESISIQHTQPNSELFLKAHKLLEEFRNSKNSFSYCIDFIQSPNESLEVRHFAYQTLNHLVTHQQNSFSKKEKEGFKAASLKFVEHGSKQNCADPTFIKEKIVQVVVSIFKREQPQNQPNFIESLFQLASQSDTSLQIVLMVFRYLAIETDEVDSAMPSQRLEDIRKGLCKYSTRFIKFFESTLKSCVDQSKMGSEKAILRKNVIEHQFRACLLAIKAHLKAPIPSIFSGQLIPMLCELCFTPLCKSTQQQQFSISHISLSCLYQLAKRHAIISSAEKPKNYDENLRLVFSTAMSTAHRILSSTSSNQADGGDQFGETAQFDVDVDERNDLLVDLCGIIVEMAKRHLRLIPTLFDDGNLEADRTQTKQLYQVMIGLFVKNESVEVTLLIVEFQSLILKEHMPQVLKKGESRNAGRRNNGNESSNDSRAQMREILTRLFETSLDKLIKGPPKNQFVEDDDEYYKLTCTNLKGSIMNFIRVLAKKDFHLLLEVLYQKIQQNSIQIKDLFCTRPNNTGNDNKSTMCSSLSEYQKQQLKLNYLGFTTMESHIYKQLDVYCQVQNKLSDFVLPKSLDPRNPNNLLKHIEQLCAILLNFSSTNEDPLLSTIVVRVIPKFQMIFETDQNAFKATLEYLLNIIPRFKVPPFAVPNSQEDRVRSQIINLRRQLQFTLIALARKIPKSFIPIFEPIVAQLTLLIREIGRYEDASLLIEFMIILSNESPDEAKRKKFLEFIIGDAIQHQTSPTTTELVSNTEKFLLLLDVSEASANMRQMIRSALSTLVALFRAISEGPQQDTSEIGNSSHKLGPNKSSRQQNKATTVLNSTNIYSMSIVQDQFKQIIPNVTSLCSLLNVLSMPQVFQCLPEHLRPVLFPTEKLERMFGKRSEISGQNANLKMHYQQTSVQLSSIRDYCYVLLSNATVAPDDFYSVNPENLIQTVLAQLEHLSLFHMKILADKFVYSLVARCNGMARYYSSFTKPILLHFLGAMLWRLENGWQELKSGNSSEINKDNVQNSATNAKTNPSTSSSNTDIDQEISLENTLRLVSRSYARFLSNISSLTVDNVKSDSVNKSKTYAGKVMSSFVRETQINRQQKSFSQSNEISFSDYLFNDEQLRELLVQSSLFLLSTCDTITVDVVCTLFTRFVNDLYIASTSASTNKAIDRPNKPQRGHSKSSSTFIQNSKINEKDRENLAKTCAQCLIELIRAQSQLDEPTFRIMNLFQLIYQMLSLANREYLEKILFELPKVRDTDISSLDKVLLNKSSKEFDKRKAVRHFFNIHILKIESETVGGRIKNLRPMRSFGTFGNRRNRRNDRNGNNDDDTSKQTNLRGLFSQRA